jgi:transposase
MTNHRSFTPEFKAQVVLEVLTGVRSASEACQHYQLKPDLMSRWKAQFLEGAATVFSKESQNDPALARVAELERLVGRLTLELEVAKKASSLWQSHLSKGAK